MQTSQIKTIAEAEVDSFFDFFNFADFTTAFPYCGKHFEFPWKYGQIRALGNTACAAVSDRRVRFAGGCCPSSKRSSIMENVRNLSQEEWQKASRVSAALKELFKVENNSFELTRIFKESFIDQR